MHWKGYFTKYVLNETGFGFIYFLKNHITVHGAPNSLHVSVLSYDSPGCIFLHSGPLFAIPLHCFFVLYYHLPPYTVRFRLRLVLFATHYRARFLQRLRHTHTHTHALARRSVLLCKGRVNLEVRPKRTNKFSQRRCFTGVSQTKCCR